MVERIQPQLAAVERKMDGLKTNLATNTASAA
jgi:hypothetical protein